MNRKTRTRRKTGANYVFCGLRLCLFSTRMLLWWMGCGRYDISVPFDSERCLVVGLDCTKPEWKQYRDCDDDVMVTWLSGRIRSFVRV